jgi:hypothetical protein
MGFNSLFNTNGSLNLALGSFSLEGLVGGNNNIALGVYAGSNLTSGNNNIFIGPYTQTNVSTTSSNQLNIGNWIYGNNGSIGIGATNPAEKLDVMGSVYANDNIYWN